MPTYTFGGMQAAIADELDRANLSANIRDSILSAISYYESERFYFAEARATLNTTASQEYYHMPSNFQKADVVTLRVGNNISAMTQRPFEAMERRTRAVGQTGIPYEYCVYASQLRLYPIPNDSYRMEISYLKKLGELSATSDANGWMTDGWDLIKARAKADLLMNKIRGQEGFVEAGIMSQREQDELRRLRAETNSRRATGKLSPEGMR